MDIFSLLHQWQAWLHRRLAIIYLVLFAPFALAFCFLMPVIEAQDEWAHFSRSVHIAYGHLVGEKPDGKMPGGQVPSQLPSFLANHLLTPALLIKKPLVVGDWSEHEGTNNIHFDNQTQFMSFPFVQYPPTSYIFSALGVDIGRLFHTDALSLFYIARFLTMLASLIMSAFAIHHINSGKYLAFFTLSTPMTLSLFGSCSQDAALIAFTALATALLQRHFVSTSLSPPATPPHKLYRYVLIAAALFACVTAGRPPYIPLMGIAPILFYSTTHNRTRALQIFILALVLPLLWIWSVRHFGSGDEFGSNHHKQIIYIFHHPIATTGVLFATLYSYLDSRSYLTTFISSLGSSGLCTLPQIAYDLGGAVMIIIFLHDCFIGRNTLNSRSRWAIGSLIFVSFVGLHIIGYIFFTPLAAPIVSGMHARYFIPLVLALTLIIGSKSLPKQFLFAHKISAKCISLAVLITLLISLVAINIMGLSTLLKTYYYT